MKAEAVRALQEARTPNTKLTVFDTGEMLEPEATTEPGVIEFTNDESIPILSVFAHPSSMHDDTVVLTVDTMGLVDDKLMIVINDGPALCHFNPETEEPPMVEVRDFVHRRIIAAAAFSSEPDAAWTALAQIAEHVGIEVQHTPNGKPYLTQTI